MILPAALTCNYSRGISDEFSHIRWDCRSTWLAVTNFPGPKESKAFPVPTDDGLWFDDNQRRSPIGPHFAQPCPQEPIS